MQEKEREHEEERSVLRNRLADALARCAVCCLLTTSYAYVAPARRQLHSSRRPLAVLFQACMANLIATYAKPFLMPKSYFP